MRTAEQRLSNSLNTTKWNKEHYNVTRMYGTFFACRRRAKEKGLEFTLTSQWFRYKALEVGVCEDTGIPFDHDPPKVKGKRHPFAHSIDRRDPNKGYTEDNCKVVVWIHNRAKGDDDLGILYHYCKEFVRAIEG